MPTITLNNMRFHAHHGVLPQERETGADFRLSLTLNIDAADAHGALCHDQLESTINYAEVFALAKEEMAQPSALLEHVVHRLARRLIRSYKVLREVTVALTKCVPPITGYDAQGVTVTHTLRRTLVAWDFDGTIADTSEGIVHTMTATFERMGWPMPSRTAICATIGLPLIKSIEQLLPEGTDAVQVEKGVALYKELFEMVGTLNITRFDGVKEEMQRQSERGNFVAIATSRGHQSVKELCGTLGLLPYIDHIVACEDVATHKPDPTPVLRLCEMTNVLPVDTTVIGDTTYDIEMGLNAGAAHLLGVAWGNHSPEQLKKAGATAIVQHF